MDVLPGGTVTFLFTDIEGSTSLWEQHPTSMTGVLGRHDSTMRGAIEEHRGHVVKTTGDGALAAFAVPSDALLAAVDAQLRLATEADPDTGPLRVRMALHTGVAEIRDGDYFGAALNRAARLMAAAHGEQVVCSHATADLVLGSLPDACDLRDLGEHRLKDLGQPERIFQIEHPGLRADFPPLRTLERFPGELPVLLTTFVGRERDVASTVEALAQARILTLIGVGGVGKTRLALQAAAEALPAFNDGAWFCELAPVTDGSAVVDAVAARLHVRQLPGMSMLDSVIAYLRSKRLLLVLDNCEHVITASGAMVEAIVHACPFVRVLATSREALAIDGELIRPVGSLGLPDLDAGIDEVTSAPSMLLFVERARSVRPDFSLRAEIVPVVADICCRLDGVPLAIELAAARVQAMTVNEIAQRLSRRFELLTGGRRTAVERHQTLRATVDWSYALLDPVDATILNRLAVFAGGCTLDAAEAVVSGGGIGAEDVLDSLSHLVARSMLVADDRNGVTRYRLLETIRQYAAERLDQAGDADAVRRRHFEHYMALARAAEVGLNGRDEEQWIRLVDADSANLRSALDWCIARGDAESALSLSLAFARYSFISVAPARWIELAAAMPEARGHRLLPQALVFATFSGFIVSGDVVNTGARLAEAEAAFVEADVPRTPEAEFMHALFASTSGDVAAAAEHGLAAVELAQAAGQTTVATFQMSMVAMLLATGGEIEPALRWAEAGAAAAARAGAPSLIALAATAQGYALSDVDPVQAVVHLQRGMSLSSRVGFDMATDVARRSLARLLAAQGDLVGALDAYASSLDLAQALGARTPTMLTCESLGVALAHAGRSELAASILGALEADVALYRGNPRNARAAALVELRATMGDRAYEEALARGAAMSVEDLDGYARAAIAALLDELRPPVAVAPGDG